MTERFAKATRQPPKGSNAQDAGADRLGAYSEGGELHSPQDAVERDRRGPDTPEPAGTDAEVIFTGGPGRSLGGPHATDRPGQASGSPAGEETPDPEDVDPADGRHRPGPFVDRLR
jgi:hypothetical protein